jgi:hypothetical protein
MGLQWQHESTVVVVRSDAMNFKNFNFALVLSSLALTAQAAAPAVAGSDRLQAACMAADLNHDGFVSLEEFHQDVLQGWRALDPNNTGYIIIADLSSIPGLGKDMIERLKSADTDGDGKLTFKEVVKARMAYFEAADTNNDDRISMQECIDHQRKMAKATGKAKK